MYVAADSLTDALESVRKNNALADALSTADPDPWREISPDGRAVPCRLDPEQLGVDGWGARKQARRRRDGSRRHKESYEGVEEVKPDKEGAISQTTKKEPR